MLILGRHLPGFAYADLIKPWHKLNHFPGTWCIGRKDRLAAQLRRARAQHGPLSSDSSRSPSSCRPSAPVWNGRQPAGAARVPSVWICKPYSSSCGRGIKLVRSPAKIGAPGPLRRVQVGARLGFHSSSPTGDVWPGCCARRSGPFALAGVAIRLEGGRSS